MFKKLTVVISVMLSVSSVQVFADVSNGMPTATNDQRVDYGWGGAGGGNLEMYSSGDSSAAKGDLRFIYGGGDFGGVRFIKYDPAVEAKWTLQTKIDKDGNWLIGDGAVCSDCKLSVKGKIQAEEIVVNTTWADYVFKPNYALRPLAEVEAYIKENQHLPGVDSAATIEANGLNFGRSSVQMMEKIEELTLYMIDLKKQNDKLQQQINLLVQKNES